MKTHISDVHELKCLFCDYRDTDAGEFIYQSRVIQLAWELTRRNFTSFNCKFFYCNNLEPYGDT